MKQSQPAPTGTWDLSAHTSVKGDIRERPENI